MGDTTNLKRNQPAKINEILAQVDTPALIVDLDAFENNLKTMETKVKEASVTLRPHSKTHKSPWIGHKQKDHGAIGLCCQKISEAEIMVDGGIKDILISNQVVGTSKTDRLASLNRDARVMICVDHMDAVSELSAAAARFHVTIETLVEIEVGGGRCGVASDKEALELAHAINNDTNLKFTGLQAYHGAAQHIRNHADRKTAINKAIEKTADTVQMMSSEGLNCSIVGGAGTGSFEMEAGSGVYTELQAGSYIFMDADYARNKCADGKPFDTFEHSLFIYATVMSKPNENKVIVDAGHKAASIDSGYPMPWQLSGSEITGMSDEHAVIDIKKVNKKPTRGDKILLVPGHCDPTVNLHDWYVGARGLQTEDPYVEHVWPISARGALS
ncbi:MAG: alanine racemase [Magnetovibrio sp.]|nr:alanine racemase [Magnetovibrio sp.]